MKFINWLDGKKSVIAAFYNAVTWPAILIWFDNTPPEGLVKANMIAGMILLFIGAGHRAVKSLKK